MTALCFSTHGHYLATGGSDKLVRVWPVDTEAGGEEWEGQGVNWLVVAVYAPHTLTPLTNCTLTTHTTHIPPGKVVSDNKERVQLTGCKASILSLQFDYQVSDTRTHTHTHPGIVSSGVWAVSLTSLLTHQEKQVLAACNDGTARIWALEDRSEKVCGQ